MKRIYLVSVFTASVAVLASCSGSSYGQYCSYPVSAYPDGQFERVAYLSVGKRWFFNWTYRRELNVEIFDATKTLFEFSQPVDFGVDIELACDWHGSDRVSFSASNVFEGNREIVLDNEHWEFITMDDE